MPGKLLPFFAKKCKNLYENLQNAMRCLNVCLSIPFLRFRQNTFLYVKLLENSRKYVKLFYFTDNRQNYSSILFKKCTVNSIKESVRCLENHYLFLLIKCKYIFSSKNTIKNRSICRFLKSGLENNFVRFV